MALNLSSLLSHLAALGQVAVQADGIKRALCRADAAANALVRVHNAGTAAQTARCLDFDLILGQRQVRVTEETVRVNARIQRGGLARRTVILAQRQIRLVQLVEVVAVAANRQAADRRRPSAAKAAPAPRQACPWP